MKIKVLFLSLFLWASYSCATTTCIANPPGSHQQGTGPDRPTNICVTPNTGGATATFTWNTNLASDSIVFIGNSISVGAAWNRQVCETSDCATSALVTSHSVTVDHLQPNSSLYYFSVGGCSTGPNCSQSDIHGSIAPSPTSSATFNTLAVSSPSGTLSWAAHMYGAKEVYKGGWTNIMVNNLLANGTFDSTGRNFVYTTALTVDGQSCLPGALTGAECGSGGSDTHITAQLLCDGGEVIRPISNNYSTFVGTSSPYVGDYNCYNGVMKEPGMAVQLITNGSTALGSHTVSVTWQAVNAALTSLGSPTTATWTFAVVAAPTFTAVPPTTFPAVPGLGSWLDRIATYGIHECEQLKAANSLGFFINGNMSPGDTQFDPRSVFNYDGGLVYLHLADQANTVSATWQALHSYSVGDQIIANGYIETVHVAGTSGTVAPSNFALSTPGQLTSDGSGSLKWTNGANATYFKACSQRIGVPYMDWAVKVGTTYSDQEWSIWVWWLLDMVNRQSDNWAETCDNTGSCHGLATAAINYLGGINYNGLINIANYTDHVIPVGTVRNLPYSFEAMLAKCLMTNNAGGCLSSLDIKKRVELIFNTINTIEHYSPRDGYFADYACCISAPVFDHALTDQALIFYNDLLIYFGLPPDPRIPVELLKFKDFDYSTYYNLTGSDFTFTYQPYTIGNNLNNSAYETNAQLNVLMATTYAYLFAANGNSAVLPTSGRNIQAAADEIFNQTLVIIPASGKGFNEMFEYYKAFTFYRNGTYSWTNHFVLPPNNLNEAQWPNNLEPFNTGLIPINSPNVSATSATGTTVNWNSFSQPVTTKVCVGITALNCSTCATGAAGAFIPGSTNLWSMSLPISGLSANTPYYYAVGGTDAQGNVSMSNCNSTYPSTLGFTTLSSGVTIQSPLHMQSPAVIGVPYPVQTLTAIGGVGPYTFALTFGSLPPGITQVGNLISGTPTGAAHSYPFSIQATDHTGSRSPAVAYGIATSTGVAGGISNGGTMNGGQIN